MLPLPKLRARTRAAAYDGASGKAQAIPTPTPSQGQNILIANREEDFMDNIPGSMFQEILNWRYQFILPGSDTTGTESAFQALNCCSSSTRCRLGFLQKKETNINLHHKYT
jgi:hypothetical protein